MMRSSSLMNRSSLSKVQDANIISLVAFLCAFILEVSFNGFHWIQVINITNFGLAWFMFINRHLAKLICIPQQNHGQS